MSFLSFLSVFFGGPFCQSCAMPLKQDPKRGGTEADGSRSKDYCSYCYVSGSFVDEAITLSDMQEKLRKIMEEKHFSPALIERTVTFLPKLKRWR